MSAVLFILHCTAMFKRHFKGAEGSKECAGALQGSDNTIVFAATKAIWFFFELIAEFH